MPKTHMYGWSQKWGGVTLTSGGWISGGSWLRYYLLTLLHVPVYSGLFSPTSVKFAYWSSTPSVLAFFTIHFTAFPSLFSPWSFSPEPPAPPRWFCFPWLYLFALLFPSSWSSLRLKNCWQLGHYLLTKREKLLRWIFTIFLQLLLSHCSQPSTNCLFCYWCESGMSVSVSVCVWCLDWWVHFLFEK